VFWLVDWDLPKTPTRHRVKFHRHLKKVLQELNHGTIKYSSMSVVITESRELADAIHRLAKENNARRTAVYAINGGWRVVHRFREHPVTRLAASEEC